MAHRWLGDGALLTFLPALAAIARDPHDFVVIQKSAQVGATELLVNLALWAADRALGRRGNVLFCMPTQNQMDDFAQARVDRAIQDSPSLRARLQPEPPRRKGADRKRLKRVGPGYLYLRGSDSARQIASVDADLVVLDEFDQMREGTLDLARKRLASSRAGRLIVASTPRYPEAGINALYLQSDQRRYLIPCRHCAHEQDLRWPENVDVETAQIVCRQCGEPLDPQTPGRWGAQAPGNARIHGYHLSRLYSPWCDLRALIEASQSETPRGQQEFHNSDLGEVFAPPGGGLSLDDLDRCRADYRFEEYADQPCVMGVDVGLKLHVVLREFHNQKEREAHPELRPRLWYAGTLDSFADLEPLLERFHVEGTVIDALPETHKVAEFCRRRPRVRVAWYNRMDPGMEWVSADNGRPSGFQLNRLEAIERALERFHDGLAVLPADARALGGQVKEGRGEYYRELQAPQRTLVQTADGNWEAKWLDHGRADHYAHAEVYCLYAEEVARTQRIRVSTGSSPSRYRGPLDGIRTMRF